MPPAGGKFLPGSFHQIATNTFYGATAPEAMEQMQSRLRCFPTHRELIGALGDTIHLAMIAVDNNNSGRVMTAIEALREHSTFRIIGKVAIAIEQRLLLAQDMQEADIQAVLSQKPALDQAAAEIAHNRWQRVEYFDTVASAHFVATNGGRYTDPSTGKTLNAAAIASSLAGEAAGLTVGRRLNDVGNATTFWLITDQPEQHAALAENPTHAAFTFSVADTFGSLHRVVRILSDAGFNLTDHDSHLTARNDRTSFFTEVELSPEATFSELSRIIKALDPSHEVTLLGAYQDRTPEDVRTAMAGDSEGKTPVQQLFSDRVNLAAGSPVVYVEAKNEPRTLARILGIFAADHVNIEDLSRPYAPTRNGERGFFAALAPGTDTQKVLAALAEEGFTTEDYVYAPSENPRDALRSIAHS